MQKKQTIRLANLFLDLRNPRYEVQGSQKEALNTLAKDQGDKLLRLLGDIIQNGLNPSEQLIVMPEEKTGKGYTVLEGNRRIAALKLLRKPEILDDSRLQAKYRKLHDKHKNDPKVPKSIECLIVDSREEAYIWIERKHEGYLDGVGTITWDSVQKARYVAIKTGKGNKILQLIDFMRQSGSQDEEFLEQLKNVSSTNLDRLMSDRAVSSRFGLTYKKGEVSSAYPADELMKGLRYIVRRLSDSDFSVGEIYLQRDREKFMSTMPEEFKPDISKKAESSWLLTDYKGGAVADEASEEDATDDKREGSNQNDNQNENQNNGGKDNSEQRPTSRETLIPADLTLTIPNERINRLFVEMKSLELNESPNICAVMMRVFVEWSIDAFLETYEVKGEKKLNVDINRGIKGKFTDVVEKIKTLHCINPDHLKGIETAFSEDRESIFSFHTLNAYVHNNTFNPIPTEIMYSWDNAEPFIKAIWKAVNDKLNKNKQK